MELEVYKITNETNGKVYIGITNQGYEVRWYKHCSDAECKSEFPVHNAIRKYGKENFQIEVIETIEDKDYDYLKEREIYWIKKFDSYNREKGYNLTLGGDGTFGRFHSEETKDKIRQKALGRTWSDEMRKKASESHKANNYDSVEMSKRCIKGNEIRWSDQKQREKASVNNPRNRKVYQYDREMNLLGEYRSCAEAAREIGKTHQNIATCARGGLKTAYGFIWKYKNNYE